MRIYSEDIGMEFSIENYAVLIMKSKTRQRTEGIELPNQGISERSEKRKNKYLGILEADTIKQAEMKEKIKKNTSGERENYSKPNSIAEILSKG